MKLHAIIFDLDQTLISDYPQHTRAFMLAGKKFGYNFKRKEIYPFFGISAKNLIRKLDPKISQKNLLELVQYKEKIYRKISRKEGVKLLPFAFDIFEFLGRKKIKYAIASSANRRNILLDFRNTGLKKFKIPFISADDVKHTKPNPEPLLKAAKLIHENPKHSAYVGDSIYEIMAAKRAGMYAVGVHTGFYSKQDLKKKGAKIVFDNLGQFKKFLERKNFTV